MALRASCRAQPADLDLGGGAGDTNQKTRELSGCASVTKEIAKFWIENMMQVCTSFLGKPQTSGWGAGNGLHQPSLESH